jgi:hypothetical protein
MKKKALKFHNIIMSLGVILVLLAFLLSAQSLIAPKKQTKWPVQSIDTMKYSRDAAGQALTDSSFDTIIDKQVKEIAQTGANYIAIGTPYDNEFLPVLKLWVKSARKYHLKVWFRGNFSGWEGWFNYPKIDREQHLKMTQEFILNNPDLFEDGDIFTACPECENGGPGDPRENGDLGGHRKFLIDEYSITKTSFAKIHKKVISNYDSMNMDVAKLVMDKKTTKALGGVVTVDHYVKSPKKLKSDIDLIAKTSGGRVVLGEFGAPIPDITGAMSDSQQAEWIKEVLALLSSDPNVIGLNYWVGVGGSTEIWNYRGTKHQAVDGITKFFKNNV